MGADRFGGGDHVFPAGIGNAIADIVENRATEQEGFLQHHADGVSQRVLRHIAHIHTAHQHRTLPYIIKPVGQCGDASLARAGGTDQRHGLVRLHPQ